MFTCPKCDSVMHSTCGNKNCVCQTGMPSDELPMKNTALLFGKITLPNGKLVSFLWHIYFRCFKKSPDINFIFELQECPYCGYSNSYDFWEERSIKQAFASEE